MAGHDLDHQFSGPGPQPVAALAPHRLLGTTTAPSHADRAGWMWRGACRSEDPELFFPIAAMGPALEQIRLAKAVCGRCPVQANCLSYALITRPDGIWGGTTTEERWAGSLPPAAVPDLVAAQLNGRPAGDAASVPPAAPSALTVPVCQPADRR